MKVYISHTGVDNWGFDAETEKSTLKDILSELNNSGKFNRIYNTVINSNSITSCSRVFANVKVVDENCNYKFYEQLDNETIEIKDIEQDLSEFDNILISVFIAESFIKLLDNTISSKTAKFSYVDENGQPGKDGEIKPLIQPLDFQLETRLQTLYSFRNGEASLSDLEYSDTEEPCISYTPSGNIDKQNSKILPKDLIEAIRSIWELPSGEGKLRLFQEDSLFFITERLLRKKETKERQLLLSMPTGGGKTEAFMIPIIASIYNKKKHETSPRVKSIVIYPTNALANDQAMRFVELIYKVNAQLVRNGCSSDNLITIGILSGDTPNKTENLEKESLIKICPKCGETHWIRHEDFLVCKNPDCGANLSFCRLTKDSIMSNPPDILITNPDEINMCLHSPNRASLFYSEIDSIVFDEVHVYQGIFGCHVAHLLRRIEELNNSKPLYIGMSATIKNAKELASLLFNEPLDGIKYINDNENRYTDTSVPNKQRLHVMLKPAIISKNADGVRYVRSMSVAGMVGLIVGHLISDSHFRKCIVFTNYRAEADDMATYIRQREMFDIQEMTRKIYKKIMNSQPLDSEELEICQYMLMWFDGIKKAVKNVAPSVIVGWNRGGLEKETRIRSVHSFSRNSLLDDETSEYPIDMMIATKSLEVGIDIGDVTTVINASAPFTANEYVQRIGRGGRKNDSLAITVINPENAIDAYFKMHFTDYADANSSIYEDAPIIINNDIIIRRHLQARLLDYIVKKLTISGINKWTLNCRDIVDNLKICFDGKIAEIGENRTNNDVLDLSKGIFNDSFEKNNNGITNYDNFVVFLKHETEILNTKAYPISKNEIINVYYELLSDLNSHIQSSAKEHWEMDEKLIGYGGHWSVYTPNLRGNGANVDLHIGNSDDITDSISRQTAFNQMPPAMNSKQVVTVHSGISTFRVDGIYKDTDGHCETKINEILAENPSIRDYYSSKIDNFPDTTSVVAFLTKFKVQVPNALSISYFPSRFYCPICQKALTSGNDYSEVSYDKNGIHDKLGHRVEQLPMVYFCEECGGVFDPPAAKICINPDCPDYKTFYSELSKNNFRVNPSMTKHFKLRLTRDLKWECQTCGCKMNYNAARFLTQDNKKRFNFIKNVATNWTESNSPEGMAVRFKKHPELFPASSNGRNRDAVFTCNNDHQHKIIKAVGVPRVRTVSYSYIGNKSDDNLCEPIINDVCNVSFKEGFVLQLATQFMRRYTSGTFGNQINRIKTDDIFDSTQGFNCLGNYYESHLAWIKFSTKLDDFVKLKTHKCDGNCEHCDLFDNLDLGESMKPNVKLEDYNFDSITGKVKKPDFRGKFCPKALSGQCNQKDCSTCSEFDKEKYYRYLIVHTIKHAILWAMPKYAGVNITDIKGEIYPNDGLGDYDIVLVDNNEGGSGAIVLIQRHWNEIWSFASEIINLTKNNEANILLNHYCFRNNADLCPFLAAEFIEYLNNQ